MCRPTSLILYNVHVKDFQEKRDFIKIIVRKSRLDREMNRARQIITSYAAVERPKDVNVRNKLSFRSTYLLFFFLSSFTTAWNMGTVSLSERSYSLTTNHEAEDSISDIFCKWVKFWKSFHPASGGKWSNCLTQK